MSKKIFSISSIFLFLAYILTAGISSSFAQRAGELKSGQTGNGQTVQRSDENDDGGSSGSRIVDPRGIVVDDDNRCPGTKFSSIQAAVNASPAGSVIQVCPGTYREQVRINKRISIIGVNFQNENQARIQPVGATANSTSLFDATPIAAVILVDGAARVTLDNLTVDGATSGFTTSCTPSFVGIYYRNASGIIQNSVVKNIKTGSGTCQNSTGIFVQSGTNGRSQVSVLNNSVHDYEKSGIIGNEVGTALTVIGNAVTGTGAAANVAQNGIQIGFGARGQVENNSVINNVNAACTTPDNCIGATNIVVVQADSATVRYNNTGNANANIYLQGNGGEISSNTIFQTIVGDGITVVGDNNNVNSNRIFNSARAAVYLQGSENRIQNNFVNEAQFGVLRADSSSGNNVRNNSFYNTALNVSTDTSSASRAQAASNFSPERIDAVRF